MLGMVKMVQREEMDILQAIVIILLRVAEDLVEQVEAARVRQLVEMAEQVDFQQKVMVVMDVMERQWGWSMLWV